MNRFKNLSDNQKITYIGILSALGFVLNYIEIPYIVAYLKFDPSELVVLFATAISLPAAIFVGIVKGLLMFLLKSGDVIGVFALILGSIIIAVSYFYTKKLLAKKMKNQELKIEIISMSVTGLIFTIVMVTLNYFFIVPLYNGLSFSEMQALKFDLFSLKQISYGTYTILIYGSFNLLKSLFISIIYIGMRKLGHKEKKAKFEIK